MSVEALSDSEIRTKLSEYGYPVGPVTQTTRKILIKKLKNLMESRGASGSRHSMAARYSSDDTDDDASTTNRKKKKAPVNTRRQTLANPMPPPAAPAPIIPPSVPKSPQKKDRRLTRNLSTADPEIVEINEDSAIQVNRSPPKTERTYTRSSRSREKDALETGSDSDVVEETPPKPSVLHKSNTATPKLLNEQTSGLTAADVNSPKPYDANWRRHLRENYDSNLRANTLTKNERYSVNLPKSSTLIDSTRNDTLSSLRDNSKKEDPLANFETPYLSEFTRRLSVQSSLNMPSISKPSLKASKYRLSSLGATPELKESDSNGHFNSTLRTAYPSNSGIPYVTSALDKTRDLGKSYKTAAATREEEKNSQNIISMALVIVLALFFGGLAIVYLGLEGKNEYPLLTADSDIPICSMIRAVPKPGANCVPEESVKDTLQFIKQLHALLTKRAIASECDGSKDPPYLNTNEIVKLFSGSDKEDTKVKENSHMAHLLIFRNPKWGMTLVDIEDDDTVFQIVDDMEKVFLTRLEGKLGVVIPDPSLPMHCLVRKRILALVTSLLIAAFGALCVIGCQKAILAYMKHKKNREIEVFQLVSEIISMLELHHQNYATTSPGGTQESYLAINHIRDNLISPKDRKKMSGLWDKAVKFLDENESRIRREVQLVSGEEFQVWRWLPSNAATPATPGSSGTPKMSKVWQGSAFETMEGSVNSPACSPTPCLKIRHMFDPDVEFEEDWETKVKDAILEKCGEGVKILHIKVDRGSREGCVYMKCMSQEDAGKAYKALHGCWFDGHLVTVKYLRLERYHERFPEAVNFKTPLKPSNNQRLSLQAHYFTNPSEAN